MSTAKTNQGESFFDRIQIVKGAMSGAEFCRIAGISTPLYQKWKNGAIPGADKLRLISTKFNKSIDWLLHGHDSSVQPPDPISTGMTTLAQEQARWLSIYKDAHASKDHDSFMVCGLFLNCVSMFEDVSKDPDLCGKLSTIVMLVHNAAKGLAKDHNKAEAKRIIDRL